MADIGIDLLKAATYLTQGDLVAIPTETVYGLAANAYDEAAVVKIFEAKNRPAFDPLIVHTHSMEEVASIAREVPEVAYQLAERFMPGPLTLILPKSEKVPLLVTSGHDSVGVRIPRHPLTLELLKQLPFPLAAPSANPFGYVSPTTAQHVQDQLGEKLPYIIDGGSCLVGIESTIIRLDGNEVEVLRLGGLALEELEEVVNVSKARIKTSSSNPAAPGMLSSHYSPRKKVLLGAIETNLKKVDASRVGVISLQQAFPGVPEDHQIQLSPAGDVSEAAKSLFAALRALDSLDLDVILAEPMPEQGLGRAINDRLQRASFQQKNGE
ncbi:L-threonylcarbamoyladenylate synthase [Rufibacter quisquiliarum]|uniref:Threonylcarbamoyl-AMP synthase n=1 Tax=Rufibacter quisquiliarum TaxID=1549639 RepID=A0A839GDQ2_9BACT|nr:L-threonylcarbamoyladenylate synthase [Rufibacter quisquiliarum]MBA9077734.1 L-threonylcarbamoyladenylate synthase [Rufibacter quisquiliarum]